MRAIVYRDYGDPDAVIEVAERPSPEPGPDEVVVALEAAPIHLADIKNIRGNPWFRAPLPAVPGYEGVGRVARVGAAVSAFAPGDRVFLPAGFGAWQEERVVPAGDLWRAPEGIAAEQLALLPINLQTAYLMLREGDPLVAGQWLIQNAANSNVGYYVIRLARALGFRTVNVVRRPDLLDEIRSIGGDVAMVDGADLADRVTALGVDIRIAFDAVCGVATDRLAACLGQDGTLVNYGFLTSDTCHVSAQTMMFRQLKVRGFFTKASLERMSEADIAAMRQELDAFIAKDAPAAAIAGIYRFPQIHEALDHAARTGSARAGKIILKP